jgi:hypothetical protein
MVEPGGFVSAGVARGLGTVAGQLLRPSPRIRLGSREERRIVYGHFLLCAVRLGNAMWDYHGTWTRFVFLEWKRDSRLIEALRQRTDELAEAAAELDLVGSLETVAAAVRVFDAFGQFRPSASAKHKVNRRARAALEKALDGYVAACQKDLWYTPQWWQVWRPRWWGWFCQAVKLRRSTRKAVAKSVEAEKRQGRGSQ